MKFSVFLLLFIWCGTAFSQNKREDFRINDSMGIYEVGQRVEDYIHKTDSSNRLSARCGIADYFQGELLTLEYRNGVSYIMGGDSMALFLVDFRNTKNVVKVKRLKMQAGMTLARFEKSIRRSPIKSTKEELERVRGIKEIAYTVYQDDTGLGYRVFFRDGIIYNLVMYIPCKEK